MSLLELSYLTIKKFKFLFKKHTQSYYKKEKLEPNF